MINFVLITNFNNIQMKIFTTFLIAISLVLMYRQGYSINKIDKKNNQYTVIKKIDNIEIRKYNKLIFASYTPESLSERNNSFRNVAGYIFGENDKNEKIAMTSPVVVKFHNKNEMAFIMPEKYSMSNLPNPLNEKIDVYYEKKSVKAVIQYSGYSNEKIEIKKINELKKKLKSNKISHGNDFELLVYNSPFDFINRRNEITVSIDSSLELPIENTNSENIKHIYLGGGCFWCIEAIFIDIIGVKNVISGYSGGKKINPSYHEVSSGLTNHAEVCKITYDSTKIKLIDILEVFLLTHDPTTLNRQDFDIGEHYRSIILYNNKKELNIIKNIIKKYNKDIYNNKIITQIVPFQNFYKAEEYHQDYYKQNKSNPYCKNIITPKLIKARKKLIKYYK